MTDTDPSLRDRAYGLYNETVDEGAHPNVNAFLKNALVENENGAINLRLNYLNPEQISDCLQRVIDLGRLVMDAFDTIFDEL